MPAGSSCGPILVVVEKAIMRHPFSLFCAMLLMLVLGTWLGRLTAAKDSSQRDRAEMGEFSAIPSPGNFTSTRHAVGKPDSTQLPAEQYVGVAFARQAADVVARSEGRVYAVYANVGDRLRSGEVIAKIESSSFTQELEIAQASVRSAKAEEGSAGAELRVTEARSARRRQLAELGVLSKEELETAQAQLEKAQATFYASQARVAEQMARITQLQQSIADTVVRAPFVGQVAVRYLDPGSTVRSGVPIVRIVRTDDMWVRFAIAEKDQAGVTPGAAVRFRPEGTSDVIPAVIEHVSPDVAAMSQEILVEAKLKLPFGSNRQIRPGDVGLVSLAWLPTKSATGGGSDSRYVKALRESASRCPAEKRHKSG
jgi:RND family efflux transporter MFP subunit